MMQEVLIRKNKTGAVSGSRDANRFDYWSGVSEVLAVAVWL